jgi:hypothetical protein
MVTRSFISNSLVVEYYYFLYYYLYYYLLHCTPGRSSTIAGVDGPHMSQSLVVCPPSPPCPVRTTSLHSLTLNLEGFDNAPRQKP